MNALTPASQGAPVAQSATLLEAILKIANDPTVDVDRFERLMSMHERMSAQHAKLQFTAALHAMQPKLPVIDERGGIKNNSGVVQSTYATYEDINDAIKPLLDEHGFTLSFKPGVAQDGKVVVTGILRHLDGHEDDATITLTHDSSGNKNTVQAVGSSLSYGKRYAVIALLNITSRAPGDRDDDGKASGLGAACQHALSEINMCEGLPDLRRWKAEKYDGLSKVLGPAELREVISLYNRRLKALKGEATHA